MFGLIFFFPLKLNFVVLSDVKLPARKQLDKLKMIRKNDRCAVCNKGVLQARLVQCNFCVRLYHLNCLDPPIRDWDHSTRWICPAHDKFLVSHLMFLQLIINY